MTASILSHLHQWKFSVKEGRIKVNARILSARLRLGLFGDVKRYGNVSEIRIDTGPGYRVYFTIRGEVLVILLCGGNKRTQQQDFKKAHQMAEQKFDFEEE